MLFKAVSSTVIRFNTTFPCIFADACTSQRVCALELHKHCQAVLYGWKLVSNLSHVLLVFQRCYLESRLESRFPFSLNALLLHESFMATSWLEFLQWKALRWMKAGYRMKTLSATPLCRITIHSLIGCIMMSHVTFYPCVTLIILSFREFLLISLMTSMLSASRMKLEDCSWELS